MDEQSKARVTDQAGWSTVQQVKRRSEAQVRSKGTLMLTEEATHTRFLKRSTHGNIPQRHSCASHQATRRVVLCSQNGLLYRRQPK